ncbi:unnamed protein product [Danaus chrysippus]|uniref:(African queen) hypothetical protein n=1 Tax=Danaus chrysippus TaxID=151541 RepID=A0A8J2W2S5_9NEOP|nr:unnamed protein product [Danaus chrysippus]
MSMFRKPKKIQRRVFCADDEEDGEPEAPVPPPPPIISNSKKENKQVKVTTLLSFADEEEEGEVFKVKKSSQSKRLSKRRQKEKQRTDGDNNKYDNNMAEQKPSEEIEEPRKKVSLEGLILSGREALSAEGAGDMSEDSEEDNRGFHTYRAESVRAALAGAGGIPDAALIHAARKTRQQARELGDFIPIKSDGGSRMMRDDDADDDDDDEADEGRIQVRGLELPSDRPERGTAAAASDDEAQSEGEEWEEQQIKKAVPSIADITGDCIPLNPFAVPPPPDTPRHLRSLARPGQAPPATAQQLVHALRDRLSELHDSRRSTSDRMCQLQERACTAAAKRDRCKGLCSELDRRYKRAQAARGYITDLVECLDEKIPQLQALEARALALHRKRRDLLVERRRADVRDQAQDVLALAARAGSSKPVDSEEKRQRTAEREGRRRARRLRRQAAGNNTHRDGDSSDDDLPPGLHHHCVQEAEAIRSLSSQLFADALPAYRSVHGVCGRMARLRRTRGLYTDAYVAQCLPKLLAPYVRHQLILWNPLADEDNEDYEKMDWYKCLMMYGCKSSRVSSDSEQSSSDEEVVSEDSVRDDPDLLLVPTLIDKVVLPKITELVEHAWDPMSVRACVRLRQLLERAGRLPVRSALPRLATTARAVLTASLNADVFLPTLPPHIVEGPGSSFWRRCLGAGVRLLRAVLCLCAPPPALAAHSVALAVIESLCCAAGAAPGPSMAAAASALAETLPRSGPVRAPALTRLATLATLALSRLHSDNPMHLKALEQARSVIAEARSIE